MNLNSFWLGIGCAGTPLGLIGGVLAVILAYQTDPHSPGMTAWMTLAVLLFLAVAACFLAMLGTLYNVAIGRDVRRDRP